MTENAVTSRADAAACDELDPLRSFPDRFVDDGDVIYLDGNSLGRLPKSTATRVAAVLKEEWGRGLVRSWEQWIGLSTELGDLLAVGVLGAVPGSVVMADSTTVNLYKLACAALDARPGRRVIVTDDDNFPSDRYVLQGLAQQRGLEYRELSTDPVSGLSLESVRGALTIDVALMSFSQVAYRSGALAEMGVLTAAAHDVGALTLWDLSHGAGAVPAELTEYDVDLAVGCSYKYLCGGPGAPAWLYVRPDLGKELRQPIWGWFGQTDQFAMGPSYSPAAGIERFLSGTPPVLSLVACEEGFRIVAEAGVARLRAKGIALTNLGIDLAERWLVPLGFAVASPRDAARRGSHVSLSHPDAYALCRTLVEQSAVVPDFRVPDRLRLGFAPLTTRFLDVWTAFERIREVASQGTYRDTVLGQRRVT